MSEPVEQEVETRFRVVDLASKPIMAIHEKVSRMSKAFDRATDSLGEMLGIAGGIGAVLSFKGALEETEEMVGKVKTISAVTGMTAQKTSEWLDVLEVAGMSFESISSTMSSIGRRAVQMGMGAGGSARIFKSMGVDLKKGPEAALLKMSELAQKGKLNSNQLAFALRMNGAEAGKFVKILSRGPEEIKKGLSEAGKFGAVVDNETLRTFNEYKQAQRDIKDAWGDMKLIIGKELLPVVTRMMQLAKEKTEAWLPAIQKVGKFLNAHLETAIGLAGKFFKVFALNLALMKGTGSSLGEWAGRGLRAMVGAKGGGGGEGGGGEGGGGGFKKLLFAKLDWKAMLFGVGKLAGVGALLAVAAKAAEMLATNAGGITDRFSRAFTALGDSVDRIVGASGAFDPEGPIGGFFELVVGKGLGAFAAIVESVNTLIDASTVLGDVIAKIVAHPTQIGDVGKMVQDSWADVEREKQKFDADRFVARVQGATQSADREVLAAAVKSGLAPGRQRAIISEFQKGIAGFSATTVPEAVGKIDALKKLALGKLTPDERAKAPTFDFRGSRFDIKQAFAEGFDPDRVAVAFANDLAAVGEHRLQSGFAPAFGVR